MMKKLLQLIQSLIDAKFYGQLVIKFEAGKISQCQKTESIKLEN